MSLRGKLLLTMSICSVAFIVFALVSWNTLNTAKINGRWYQKIVQDKDLIADILPPPEYIVETYLVTFQLVDKKNQAKANDLVEKLKGLRQEYAKRHEFWQRALPNGAMKEELLKSSYEPAWKFFETLDKEVIPAILRNDYVRAQQVVSNVLGPLYEEHRKSIDKVVKMAEVDLQKDEKTVKGIVDNRIMVLTALGLIILATLIFFGYYLNISIARPIKRIIVSLNEGANQITSASTQVSSASQQLAEGASQQAAALEETSSSLEEMSSMTGQNAENANQANGLIMETTQTINQANRSMTALTESMKDITAASGETAKIIKTIDEIAFQTNLLALNAAVEAARAGDAGAGFAVVADEVRNLAMRAAEAAKNTANLIESTVTKVKEGDELVSKTAADFEMVANSTNKAKELVAEIAAASNEQASGISQINKAVSEMDKVVQQNAANAEESASASEELNAQSEQMKGVVGELVALVDGKTSNHFGAARTRKRRLLKQAWGDKAIRALTPSRRDTELLAHNGGKRVSPEQVIPLEREFKDF
ncbi:MAG: methyl-accepting chemotaxis protein [Thermodesulfobacteriota bacterium]